MSLLDVSNIPTPILRTLIAKAQLKADEASQTNPINVKTWAKLKALYVAELTRRNQANG